MILRPRLMAGLRLNSSRRPRCLTMPPDEVFLAMRIPGSQPEGCPLAIDRRVNARTASKNGPSCRPLPLLFDPDGLHSSSVLDFDSRPSACCVSSHGYADGGGDDVGIIRMSETHSPRTVAVTAFSLCQQDTSG